MNQDTCPLFTDQQRGGWAKAYEVAVAPYLTGNYTGSRNTIPITNNVISTFHLENDDIETLDHLSELTEAEGYQWYKSTLIAYHNDLRGTDTLEQYLRLHFVIDYLRHNWGQYERTRLYQLVAELARLAEELFGIPYYAQDTAQNQNPRNEYTANIKEGIENLRLFLESEYQPSTIILSGKSVAIVERILREAFEYGGNIVRLSSRVLYSWILELKENMYDSYENLNPLSVRFDIDLSSYVDPSMQSLWEFTHPDDEPSVVYLSQVPKSFSHPLTKENQNPFSFTEKEIGILNSKEKGLVHSCIIRAIEIARHVREKIFAGVDNPAILDQINTILNEQYIFFAGSYLGGSWGENPDSPILINSFVQIEEGIDRFLNRTLLKNIQSGLRTYLERMVANRESERILHDKLAQLNSAISSALDDHAIGSKVLLLDDFSATGAKLRLSDFLLRRALGTEHEVKAAVIYTSLGNDEEAFRGDDLLIPVNVPAIQEGSCFVAKPLPEDLFEELRSFLRLVSHLETQLEPAPPQADEIRSDIDRIINGVIESIKQELP